MIVAFVVSCVLVFVTASPVSLEENADEIFDQLIASFNEIFPRPITMPELEVTFPLLIGDTEVTTRVFGVLVDGKDLTRVGGVLRSGHTWEAPVSVGNISFAYHNLTVSFLNESHRGVLEFRPLERPILLGVTRNETACSVSTGPFGPASVPHSSHRIEGEIRDPASKRIVSQLFSRQDFSYEFFLRAFLTAVHDPLYLLVRQHKLCPILHINKP